MAVGTDDPGLETAAYAADFNKLGYAIIPQAVDRTVISQLRTALENIPDGEAVRRKRGVYGVRTLLELSPDVRELAGSAAVRDADSRNIRVRHPRRLL